LETVNGPLETTKGILRICKSKRQAHDFLAKAAEEHHLCLKLLGLEKTKGSCFAYHLEQCYGACVGKELPAAYNMRCTEAFSTSKIKEWPFEQPILIHEGQEDFEEYLLIDQWCFLGSVINEDELSQTKNTAYEFDYDTYKLLVSFILNPKNKRKIKFMPVRLEVSDEP
jgi:DNA polymerase-3 subunit epsilon